MTEFSSHSSSAKGKPLRSQSRQIVYNIAKYLKEQKDLHKLKYNVAQSASEATGISVATVHRIIAEGKQSALKGKVSFSTPTRKKTPHAQKVEVDDFTRSVIRRQIHHMYTVQKTLVTLKKLNSILKEDHVLNCSRETLRKLLRKMGFKWTKCQSVRKLLIEKPAIVAWRSNYLREIRKHRQAEKNIVYVDETYLHATHSGQSCWQSDTETGHPKSIGKGQRLIIVHGGGERGFVENALLIFKSGQKKGDYHDEMNFNNFSKWVTEKLIPNLDANSVVVLDNAAYHNVQENKKPTMSSLKSQIMDWLHSNGVMFEQPITKAELMVLVNKIPTEPIYSIDKILLDAGHSVLRLPPYHPDLNPIELVWGDIKGRVGECVSDSLKTKRELAEKLFAEYTTEKWVNCCRHVKDIEDSYWRSDALMDEVVDNIIISVNNDSSESEISNSDANSESANDMDT